MYKKDTNELIAWVFGLEMGISGSLFMKEEYKRQGFGTNVLLIFSEKLNSEDGFALGHMRDCAAKWRKSIFIFTMILTLLFFIVPYTYYISFERSGFEPSENFPRCFSEPVQTVQKPVQT